VLPRVSRALIDGDAHGGIDRLVDLLCDDGCAVVEGVLPSKSLVRLNAEIDRWLASHPEHRVGPQYPTILDSFQGLQTLRIQGLIQKTPSVAEFILHPVLLGLAERFLHPICAEIALSAAEVIELWPGQPGQFPHRDTDLWNFLPPTRHAVAVNVMVALSPFTRTNGATRVAPRSYLLPPGTAPAPDQFEPALMAEGDALILRGDLFHGGGPNETGSVRRRALSLSYQVGWLRTFENGILTVPPSQARRLPPRLQDLLGYAAHDAGSSGGGVLGLWDGRDPHGVLALFDSAADG